MRNRLCALLILASLSICSDKTHAQDTHDWIDPAGGVYGTFTKWDPVPFPTAQDTARFDLDATYTVAFIESRAAAALQIDDGAVTFDGSGIFGTDDRLYSLETAAVSHGAQLALARSNQNRDINLDVTGRVDVIGTLSIEDSSEVTSASGRVDSESSSFTALVKVEGTNGDFDRSIWNVDELAVGPADRGRVSISDGGIVNSEFATIGGDSGSLGDVQVRGLDSSGSLRSTWTQTSNTLPSVIGDQGRGLLTIEDGGLVTSQNVEMGKQFGGVGDVTIRGSTTNGTRSTWSTRDLVVGVGGDFGGTGSLQVIDGGIVTSGNSLIGAGQVVVQGANAEGIASHWTTGELTVGDVKTNGTLNVREDGAVTSGTTYIGKQTAGGTISLTGDGPGALSTWSNSGNVYLGGSDSAAGGLGELSVGTDSQVDIGGTLKIWDRGRVEINLGSLSASEIVHTAGGEFDFLGGRLQFDRFVGDLTNSGGTLAPGPDTKSMLLTDDYMQQSTGVLEIELGGTVAGTSHDDVEVGGEANLGGQLELSIVGGFRPETTQVFDILSARLITGSFDNVLNGGRLATNDGTGSFVVHYGAGSLFNTGKIFLTDYQAATVPADLNMDTFVDGLDLGILLGNFENNATPAGGELNGTDPVDGLDLGILLGAWNPAAISAATSVPEPTSLFLFGLGWSLLINCRRMIV